jgi:hypothetical protein
MKKREKVKIRKPVAMKPTKVILSKKDRMNRKRIRHKYLIKLAFLHESV